MKEIRYTMAVELQQNSLLNQKGSVFFYGNDAITSECDVADVPPDEDLNISTPSNLSPVNSDLLLFTQVILIFVTVYMYVYIGKPLRQSALTVFDLDYITRLTIHRGKTA